MLEEQNPYRPPGSKLADTLVSSDSIDASKGRRFGTLLVDNVCYLTLTFVFSLAMAVAFGPAWLKLLQRIPNFLVGTICICTYYLVFESIWARTPGKLVFGTIVCSESGGRATFRQIAIRTLCRLIPFEPLSFFGERGWHDSISKTRVVRVQKP